MQGLLDDVKCGILVLLYLSTTYDTVVQNILLQSYKNIVIALACLRSYLEHRTHCIQIRRKFDMYEITGKS